MAWIELPADADHVFVFGSNVMGRHDGGAARLAEELYGAQRGVGEGPTGRCYALPTVGPGFVRLPLAEVAEAAARFLAHARLCPHTTFWLTPVGCGIAGFTPAEIAPLFRDAPLNVRVPEEFLSALA